VKEFKAGDWAIYRKQKVSPSPGPRAQMTTPSTRGETYAYLVDKFWIVRDVLADGRLRLVTRRGKEHLIASDDPRLRRPNWIQRWLQRDRFLAIEAAIEEAKQGGGASAVPPANQVPVSPAVSKTAE
jgi:hypothetical protein